MTDITPFEVHVDDAVLTDLRERLLDTRWPGGIDGAGWHYGAPQDEVRRLCEAWVEFDWRAAEAKLNAFPQFLTEIDGEQVHFLHVRSDHPGAVPLLLTHGWPGSIAEFLDVIGPLVYPPAHGGDAADAFHVIAPSIPGYGFSGPTRTQGVHVRRVAEMWAELMARLGYDRYVAQGGDWGSAITSVVGAVDPAHCAAIHLTLAMSTRPPGTPTEPDELHAMERIQHYVEWDSGYSTQQKSRPQTLGYGLADSPAAQAAWILEKFWSWTDCDGHPENALTRDEMLDNIMLYWVTESATSSARIYWESFGRAERAVVEVPTGFTVYPREIVPPVRSWVAELYPNVVYWNEQPKGGHFAALEVPDAFVADLRECFRPHR